MKAEEFLKRLEQKLEEYEKKNNTAVAHAIASTFRKVLHDTYQEMLLEYDREMVEWAKKEGYL